MRLLICNTTRTLVCVTLMIIAIRVFVVIIGIVTYLLSTIQPSVTYLIHFMPSCVQKTLPQMN